MTAPITCAAPNGPPPPFQFPVAHVLETPASEPPPPYTARASDPLPTWASLVPRFEDMTDSEAPSDLIRAPLDPPPECFSTSTPLRIRSRAFAPFRIPSRGTNLSGGFRLLYAPDVLSRHGITAKDWVRFLQDLAIVAKSAPLPVAPPPSPKSTSPPSPLIGWLRGRAGSVYDAAFGKSSLDEVTNLINVWNQSAFERRKLKVTLHLKSDDRGNIKEGFELLVEAL